MTHTYYIEILTRFSSDYPMYYVTGKLHTVHIHHDVWPVENNSTGNTIYNCGTKSWFDGHVSECSVYQQRSV